MIDGLDGIGMEQGLHGIGDDFNARHFSFGSHIEILGFFENSSEEDNFIGEQATRLERLPGQLINLGKLETVEASCVADKMNFSGRCIPAVLNQGSDFIEIARSRFTVWPIEFHFILKILPGHTRAGCNNRERE